MWLIVAQVHTVGQAAHQLVVIIVLQLQRLQLYTMGHYPEMLLEHYAKKSICKFCSFYTCKIYKCKSILLLVRWNFFFSFVFLRKKTQKSANQPIMTKKKMLLNTTIFCRKKTNWKNKNWTTTRKTQKRKIRFSFKQGCDFIVFESL